jgi:hypothetical protein
VSSASISRLTVLTAAGCAVAFSCASLSIGFGWVASIGSALIGAASGYSIIHRAFAKGGPASLAAERIRSRERWLPAYAQPFEAARSGSRAFHVFIGPFLSLPPYQRFASTVFLLQSVVSLVLISGFCVAQLAGFNVRVLNAPSFAALFADAYPIDAGDTLARTRFDNLFLPLVSLYLISLSSLAVALFHSLGPLLRGIRQHAKLLATIVFFLVALWLLLFVGGSTGGRSLQKHIIDGDAFGYIGLFVFLPMIWVFIASGLPDERY